MARTHWLSILCFYLKTAFELPFVLLFPIDGWFALLLSACSFRIKSIRQPSKNLWTKVERLKSVEWFIVCCYRCRSLSFFESIELLSSPCWRFFQFLILIIIIITILSCTHFTDLRKTVHHSASSLAQPRPSLRWRWQLHLFSFAIWLTALS